MHPTHRCFRCDDCKALDRVKTLLGEIDAEIRALQKIRNMIAERIWAA